ncbi:MAG: hypothetical protein HN337_02890 [Deltaproteobacteria bacterium]|nr:hypothetical protein [Deltaproteobacteria bacterium]
MTPVFVVKKFHRTVSSKLIGGACRISRDIFSPSCQYLPGFKIIPRRPPVEWTWQGKWYTIDF